MRFGLGFAIGLCIATGAAISPAGLAAAEDASDYPGKPVRLIVPLQAGSAVDLLARTFGHKLGEVWNQQFIVENRPGAAGTFGAQSASKAPPDGYALLVTTNAPLTTSPVLYRKLEYSWEDFEPIAVVAQAPTVLIVNPALGVNSISELLALSRRMPSGASAATGGNGSIGHFVLSDMQRRLGANFVNVHYRGGVAGVTAVAAGEAQVGVLDTGSAISFIKDGRVRALGIVAPRRATALPDVPTLGELGLSGSDIVAWVSFVAPKGTPAGIVQKLSAEIARALKDPQVRQRLITAGMEPVDGSTPQQFAGYLREEVSRWRQRVQDTGLKLE